MWSLKLLCVCSVLKQLTLQYLGLSVISPLYTLPLQQVSKRVCAPYSPSPRPWRIVQVVTLSSPSAHMGPEGIALIICVDQGELAFLLHPSF